MSPDTHWSLLDLLMGIKAFVFSECKSSPTVSLLNGVTPFLINLATQPQPLGGSFSKPKRFLDLRIIWSHAHTHPPVILLQSWQPSPEQQMPPAVLMVAIHPSADSFMQSKQDSTKKEGSRDFTITPIPDACWQLKSTKMDRKCASEAAFTSS